MKAVFLMFLSMICLSHAQMTGDVLRDLKTGEVYLLPDRVKRVASVSDDGTTLKIRISARLASERWSQRYTVTVPRSTLKASTPSQAAPPQLIGRKQLSKGWTKGLEENRSTPVSFVHRKLRSGEGIGPDLLSLKPDEEQKVVSVQTGTGGGRWMFFHLHRAKGASIEDPPHVAVMQLQPKTESGNRLGDYAKLPLAVVNDAAALSLYLFTKGLSGYAGP